MKAESTIRKQISRLKKVYEKSNHKVLKSVVDAEYMTLKWVIGDNVGWSPASLAEALLKNNPEWKVKRKTTKKV